MTKMDKSNPTVVVNKTKYIQKTKEFINNNYSKLLNKDQLRNS